MIRSAREIASRAMVYGALGFRASLEVTIHARSVEISGRLFSWLDELGLAGQIEPDHREILETAHGQLAPRDRTEAYWCGDGAAAFGWAVQVFDASDPTLPVDSGQLVKRLNLLRPEAAKLIAEATLRPESEIERFCAFCLAVRHAYQKRLASPENGLMDQLGRIRMAELGPRNVDRAIEEASAFADRITPPPADCTSFAPWPRNRCSAWMMIWTAAASLCRVMFRDTCTNQPADAPPGAGSPGQFRAKRLANKLLRRAGGVSPPVRPRLSTLTAHCSHCRSTP